MRGDDAGSVADGAASVVAVDNDEAEGLDTQTVKEDNMSDVGKQVVFHEIDSTQRKRTV